jgi:hypothetical protein
LCAAGSVGNDLMGHRGKLAESKSLRVGLRGMT